MRMRNIKKKMQINQLKKKIKQSKYMRMKSKKKIIKYNL